MAPTNKRNIKTDTEESKAKVKSEESENKLDSPVEPDDLDIGSQENLGGEMNSIMNMFQTTIAQKTGAKRKRSEQFLNASVKVSAKKMEEVVQRQGLERKKLQEQYQCQIDTLIHTWDGEIEKCKEMEEKLATTFRQQQKFYTTLRVNQTKILNDMKGLCTQYNTAIDQLEKLHTSQQGDLQGELKREVSLLHKKYLMDTQTAELAKMKQNMHQILTSSF